MSVTMQFRPWPRGIGVLINMPPRSHHNLQSHSEKTLNCLPDLSCCRFLIQHRLNRLLVNPYVKRYFHVTEAMSRFLRSMKLVGASSNICGIYYSGLFQNIQKCLGRSSGYPRQRHIYHQHQTNLDRILKRLRCASGLNCSGLIFLLPCGIGTRKSQRLRLPF